MNEEDVKTFRKQHVDNYRNAVIDIIHNNTKVLVDEDIASLLKTPPLDSMDVLKTKLLSLAKKHKIILQTDVLNQILESYRLDILKCCSKIKKIREETLISKVKKSKIEKPKDVIRINKKDFVDINREIKQLMKEQLFHSFQNKILKKINGIFPKEVDDDIQNSIIEDLTKYMKNTYRKQLLENVDIKILVKDTTLMNSTKEQAERYLFTLKNSRLLNDLEYLSFRKNL